MRQREGDFANSERERIRLTVLSSTAGTDRGADKLLEAELSVFVCYFKLMPRVLQRRLMPVAVQLKLDYPSHRHLEEAVDTLSVQGDFTEVFQIAEVQPLINMLVSWLQLSLLPAVFARTLDRIDPERNRSAKPQLAAKKAVLEKIDLLHPEYETYIRMSKQEKGQTLHEHHVKPRERHFYAEPRLVVKLEELRNFQQGEKNRGNILFLNYQGDFIRGSRVLAVLNNHSIELWERVVPDPPLFKLFQDGESGRSREQDRKDEAGTGLSNNNNNRQKQARRMELSHRLVGHAGKVLSVSFSLDEYYMVSCGVDLTVKLWCLRTKSLLEEFKSHTRTVWDVDFSPSGYYFLSASADGLVILWRTDVPNPQRVYHHKLEVMLVRFARDPSYLLSAGEDCTVKIWKTAEAELVRELRFCTPVIRMCLGFSGVYLAVAEVDGKISIFDLLKGELINSFSVEEPQKAGQQQQQSKKMKIHDLCFSQDEREFAAVSSRYVLLYSMERLEMKIAKNIFSIYEGESDKPTSKVAPAPKEVIAMPVDTNLTYACYQHKNVLVVAGTKKKI